VDSTAALNLCTPWARARRASFPWIMSFGIVFSCAQGSY
jgi:hypothetical protein